MIGWRLSTRNKVGSAVVGEIGSSLNFSMRDLFITPGMKWKSTFLAVLQGIIGGTNVSLPPKFSNNGLGTTESKMGGLRCEGYKINCRWPYFQTRSSGAIFDGNYATRLLRSSTTYSQGATL